MSENLEFKLMYYMPVYVRHCEKGFCSVTKTKTHVLCAHHMPGTMIRALEV